MTACHELQSSKKYKNKRRKVKRRSCYVKTVLVQLVIFTLLLLPKCVGKKREKWESVSCIPAGRPLGIIREAESI